MEMTREAEFPFTFERSEDGGDGLTLEGYAAVFNSPTDIRDQDGDYTEIVSPGAFKRTLQRQTPVLMFNHGKHPLLGDMPLGKIQEVREDPRGLYVRARLSDNWLVQPVRDAIAAKAITGMSFRFEVVKDDWSAARDGRRTRTLKEVKAPELGPVVYPAYRDTAVAVRSALTALADANPDMHITIGESRDDVDADISTWEPDIRDMVADAIEEMWGISDTDSDVYIIDLHDNSASLTVKGRDNTKYPGLWIVDYTFAEGNLTVGTPTKAQATVIPTGVAGNQTPANMSGGMNSADPDGEDRAKYNADQLRTMAKRGHAMPDGSYPIGDREDLQNAIHAVGRGSGSHAAIRRHIIRRAKALGASNLIPSGWSSSGSMSGTNADTSNELAESTSEELVDTDRGEAVSKAHRIRQARLEAAGIL